MSFPHSLQRALHVILILPRLLPSNSGSYVTVRIDVLKELEASGA